MTTSIAERPAAESKPLTIRQRLQDPALLQEIAKAMPAHCKPERMARIAMTAITRTPKLADCDQASFFRCLLELSQWGLEPDGRRAHLIPFDNRKRGVTECTLILDYKGLVELAYRSGIVEAIHADVVRRGDLFRYSMGEVQEHVPYFLRNDADKPEDEGEVFAAYCVVRLQGGCQKTEVLSYAEIDGIRKRSKAGQAGPWVSDWCEMAKKTAFRRVSKWLPLSAEIHDAMDKDEDTLNTIAPPRRAAVTSQPITGLTELLTQATEENQGPHIDEANQDTAHTFEEFESDCKAAYSACEGVLDVNKREKELEPRANTDAERAMVAGMAEERREQISSSRGSRSNK